MLYACQTEYAQPHAPNRGRAKPSTDQAEGRVTAIVCALVVRCNALIPSRRNGGSMSQMLICDYCGEPITWSHPATVSFNGIWENGGVIHDDQLHFHPGSSDDKENSCYVKAFRLIDARERHEADDLERIPVMPEWEHRDIERKRRTRSGTPLARLGLSTAFIWKFERHGVYTVEDLCRLEEAQLYAIKGFGPKRVAQIKQDLEVLGLSLQP
jgi:hypothetical protein